MMDHICESGINEQITLNSVMRPCAQSSPRGRWLGGIKTDFSVACVCCVLKKTCEIIKSYV